MKIKTKTQGFLHWLPLAIFPCLLLLAGCHEENTPATSGDEDEPVELKVDAGVATLTRSAIQGGSSAESGTDADNKLKSIAVYAQCSTTNTSVKNNNYALYTRSGSTWSSGTDKIYLSSDDATVYAYHPAYQPDAVTKAFNSSGTALKLAADVTDASTIPVSVYEGSASDAASVVAIQNNADKSWQSNAWTANTAGKDLIASAPGEVDYMYGTPNKKVDNGKGASPVGNTVNLAMGHALTMVSFRIYNDGTYHHNGVLTQIRLYNASGVILSKGTSPVMNVKTGAITAGTAVAANFIRKVTYTLITVASPASASSVAKTANATVDNENAAAASKKFSILVLPETGATSKTGIKAVFTIDDTNYDVAMANGGTNQWEKGKNYLYTVKLSGKELSVTNVTVTPWSTQTGGNLDIY